MEGGFLKQKQLEGRRVPRGSSVAKTWLELDKNARKIEDGVSPSLGWSQGLDNCLEES